MMNFDQLTILLKIIWIMKSFTKKLTQTIDKELYSMQTSMDESSGETLIEEKLPSGLPQTFDVTDSPDVQNK